LLLTKGVFSELIAVPAGRHSSEPLAEARRKRTGGALGLKPKLRRKSNHCVVFCLDIVGGGRTSDDRPHNVLVGDPKQQESRADRSCLKGDCWRFPCKNLNARAVHSAGSTLVSDFVVSQTMSSAH
jgi:hypothetical protein